ncbi:MAG: YCF48-related protein, partial [Vicinamibacterales bacterium]
MRITRVLTGVLLLTTMALAQGTWTPLTTGVTATLRGISAVSADVAWSSGNRGTVLRTLDGGATWRNVSPAGHAALDFRDVDAISAQVAYILSIGNGDASRILKTTDGGSTWVEQFVNSDADGFFDAMSFW